MNLKDFKSVTATLGMDYTSEGTTSHVTAVVQVDRNDQVVITIPGVKHANAFIEMILTQQLTGFSTIQQPAQKGIPGHNVEVTTEKILDEVPCPNHFPLQHRDGKEPWCDQCGLNKDNVEPTKSTNLDALPIRPSRIEESRRKFEEGTKE